MAFKLIDSVKANQNYKGPAEECTYTFTVLMPDQMGSSWTAQQMLNGHITELQSQGSLLLEYRLYEDKLSGTWTTEYKVEIVASASPLWWSAIIIGVLSLLSIIFIAWSIQNVKEIVEYGGPGAVIAPSIAIFALAALAGILLLKRGT